MINRKGGKSIGVTVAKRFAVGVLGAVAFAGVSSTAQADSVTVEDVSTWSQAVVVDVNDPYLGYPNGIDVYAGINTFQITDNTTGQTSIQNGFCIDPYHFSVPVAGYTTEQLASAPKTPGGAMGTYTADAIEQLWAAYYNTATTNPTAAAALQLAIWQLIAADPAVIGNPAYAFTIDANSATSLEDQYLKYVGFDVSTMQLTPQNPTTHPEANLIGLVANSSGQDYVVACLPDTGTTLALLGMGFLGLLGFGKVIEAKPALGSIRTR